MPDYPTVESTLSIDQLHKLPDEKLGHLHPHDTSYWINKAPVTLYGTVPCPSTWSFRELVHVSIKDSMFVDPRTVDLLRPYMQ